MIIYIFGVGGVGKTTISKKVVEIHSKTSPDYTIKRICGVNPFNPKKENQKDVFIFDRYLTSWRDNFRTWKSPKKHHKHLAAIMLITAPAKLIYQRRLHDEKRPDRYILDLKFLNKWKQFEKKAAYDLSTTLQIPIKVIKNDKRMITVSRSMHRFVIKMRNRIIKSG